MILIFIFALIIHRGYSTCGRVCCYEPSRSPSGGFDLSSSIAQRNFWEFYAKRPTEPTTAITVGQLFAVFRYVVEALAGRLVFSQPTEQVTRVMIDGFTGKCRTEFPHLNLAQELGQLDHPPGDLCRFFTRPRVVLEQCG